MNNPCITEVGPLQPAELATAATIAATAPDPWRENDLATALADERRLCLAARRNGLLEGFICLRVLGEEAELEMLAVAPASCRQGAGRTLVRAGLLACKKRRATRCLLELRVGNAAARKLYESLGFTTLAKRPAMYANPREDGLCMQLVFK